MKRLLLATKDKTSNEQYFRELFSVFAGYLEIDSYCWEIEKENPNEREILTPDVLLMGSPYSFPESRPFIKQDTKILLISFTFGKEIVKKLSSLPIGTETVTCYKHYSEAHQAAYVLYELGLQNLNLYINYPGNKNMLGKKMDVAVYSGDPIAVPTEGNPTIIDLGPMFLSLDTLLDIALSAGILNDELEKRILTYCKKIAMPKNNTSYYFNNSSMASMSLRAVTDCIDYGMIILDEDQKIINYNEQFLRMFKIDYELSGKNILEVKQLSRLLDEMLGSGEVKDCIVKSVPKNMQLLMSKEKINKDNKDFDVFLILFKDITEIYSLENAFHKQAHKQGYIAKHSFDEIVHGSEKMDTLISRCKKIATVDKPTLIVGESGTGKELFASSIHNVSKRSKFPFVAINCATIPENLLESELFGYEDGAFTGAKKGGKIGLFQAANRGTLFLDEIGELSLEMQAKLLRVLEEKEIMRVGGDEIIEIDTRIIAATNRDLKALVESGSFRLDLYYRLNTMTVSIPPLRYRKQDIPALINNFISGERKGFSDIEFCDGVKNFFLSYSWPGNVRELRNCIEYMISIGTSPLGITDLPDYLLEEYMSIEGQGVSDEQSLSGKRTVNNNGEIVYKDGQTLPLQKIDNCMSIEQLSYVEKNEIRAILTLISEYPFGRRKLHEALIKEGVSISEYKLRQFLDTLRQEGFIYFGSGSSGCRITENGKHFMDEFKG